MHGIIWWLDYSSLENQISLSSHTAANKSISIMECTILSKTILYSGKTNAYYLVLHVMAWDSFQLQFLYEAIIKYANNDYVYYILLPTNTRTTGGCSSVVDL